MLRVWDNGGQSKEIEASRLILTLKSSFLFI